MAAIITNFQAPKELDDLVDRYERDGLTNIDHLLQFDDTLGEWTVDKNDQVGDTVFFMCAVTSKDHMRRVLKEAKELESSDIIAFAEDELELYEKYAGKIVAVGVIEEPPFDTYDSGYAYPGWRSPWYAKIGQFRLLDNPVSIDDFRSFIKVSRTGAITKLTTEQETQLKSLIKE